jgi:hypothetical protein
MSGRSCGVEREPSFRRVLMTSLAKFTLKVMAVSCSKIYMHRIMVRITLNGEDPRIRLDRTMTRLLAKTQLQPLSQLDEASS